MARRKSKTPQHRFLADVPIGAPDMHYLFPPKVRQEQTNWCWAGAAGSIMQHHGRPVSQCSQANRLFGQSSCCSNGSSAACNRGASVAQIGQNFSNNNFRSSQTGPLSLDGIVAETYNNNRPFEAAIWWLQSGQIVGGHAVVVAGYNKTESKVYFMDPGYADHYEMPYATFRSAPHRRWDYSWTNVGPR